MLGVVWEDCTKKFYLGTRGSSFDGVPHSRDHKEFQQNGTFKWVSKFIDRPTIAKEYHDNAIVIDGHNNLRQNSKAFEEIFQVKRWYRRYILTILGIISTNAYLGYKMEMASRILFNTYCYYIYS